MPWLTLSHPIPTAFVAVIGNFDGGHLGHQALLQAARIVSQDTGLGILALTFEPLTHEYFSKQPKIRLMRLQDKIRWFRSQGVHRVGCLSFGARLAALSAEQFMQQYLQAQGVQHVVVGDDFRFGVERAGDASVLRTAGFTVTEISTIGEGTRVSSSQLRRALQDGRLGDAALGLGRLYQLSGRVMHGDKRARLLGFPTANLFLGRYPSPLQGVFAVRVQIQAQWYRGVANIGMRPTVQGTKRLCEVHVFDYEQDLYGQRLIVEPTRKIRDEQRFESLEQLRLQIQADVHSARLG